MGFFDRFKNIEQRSEQTEESSIVETKSDEGSASLEALFETDKFITEERAMTIPAVRACVDLISSKIAQMPFKLYETLPDGSIKPVINDNRTLLLNDEPNNFLNGSTLKKLMAKDLAFRGASYVKVHKAGNKVLELHPVPASSVVVIKRIKEGYEIVGADIEITQSQNGLTAKNKKSPKYPYHNFIVSLYDGKNGVEGQGIIHQGQEILKLALQEMEVNSGYYKRGAIPLGILETGATTTGQQRDALKKSWSESFTGFKNAFKTAILPAGTKYHQLSPAVLSDIMGEKYNRDIYKMFGIPIGMVSTSEGKQYQSLQQNQQSFVENTLMPYVIAIEEAVNRALLTTKEKKQGMFFRLDTSELIRGTEKERLEAAEIGIRSGVYTLNQAKEKFDLPKLPRELTKFASGDQFYDSESNVFYLNGQVIDDGNKAESDEGDDSQNEGIGIS